MRLLRPRPRHALLAWHTTAQATSLARALARHAATWRAFTPSASLPRRHPRVARAQAPAAQRTQLCTTGQTVVPRCCAAATLRIEDGLFVKLKSTPERLPEVLCGLHAEAH